MPAPRNYKRLVLTGAVTAITIAGSLYGAGIKTGQEAGQQVQKKQEASLDERIATLQGIRDNLSSKRLHVQKQLDDLDARVEDKKRKGLGGPKNGDS
ncbi:hypothetical protein P168DRAFT_320828 [Aspergillus campestris IBT 28561]|uniref:Uncharacterized protein n=1 Tax=Aspergillus campestris (strain IBT 28561) TaxID=1392248 RepID=A0A2I1CXF4_ASPC2|nr:uncharacterized protein P168DRAFT_320828 [Aspergillus campestris IBT 28561]PKY02283.1 hypothetical protein P168DRAFT_320828 [Aspergillus campestris IBT 28561]